MAGSDKTVKVTLVAVATPYTKGMGEAASATKKLGADIDGVSAKQKGFASNTTEANKALKGMALAGGAAVGAGLVALLTDSVRAAGDLQQSIGGVDAVFKDSADTIHAFGETSADAVGLSRNEFNKLITTTGAMLKNKGLEDFTNKSLDLVKVGADLAAQFGGSTADAVEALNAAMRGESDPIERYGISLNETAVNAELASKGLQGLTGQALEQAKAQARIDIITRQSADALGAFGREADTLQGQQQRLNAEWEDAKAALGTALLPVLTDVMGALRGGVDVIVATAAAFEAMPGPIKAAVGALIALHLLRGPLAGMLSSTITQVKTLSATLKGGGIAGSAKAAGAALMGALGGPLGIAIGVGTAALTYWYQEAERVNQIATELKGTIDKATGAFTGQSKATIKDALFGDLSNEDIKRLQQLGVDFDALASAALQGGPALADARASLDGLKSMDWLFIKDDADIIDGLQASLGRAADGAERTKITADDASTALGGTGTAAGKAATNIDTMAAKTKLAGDEAAAARDAHKELATAILEVSAAAGDADAAEIAYQQSLDDATASVKEHGKTLDINTEAGRANKTALLDLKDAALANAEAAIKNGESTDDVKDSVVKARDEFVTLARKMGLSKAKAEELATEYGLTKGSVDGLKTSMDKIPKEVKSKVEVSTAAAKTAIAGVKALLDALDRDREINVTVNRISGIDSGDFVGGGGGTRKAAGGYIAGPGTATSDSIPAYLSNGEYVLKAAAVAKYGRAHLDDLNAMRFASGGYVSRMPAQSGSAPIDYDRLAMAVGPALTLQIPGADPLATARHAINEWEWRSANG